jgi:hypothetical protein
VLEAGPGVPTPLLVSVLLRPLPSSTTYGHSPCPACNVSHLGSGAGFLPHLRHHRWPDDHFLLQASAQDVAYPLASAGLIVGDNRRRTLGWQQVLGDLVKGWGRRCSQCLRYGQWHQGIMLWKGYQRVPTRSGVHWLSSTVAH